MRATIASLLVGFVLATVTVSVRAEGVPRPDALLMVDQHREAIVERVIKAWPEALTVEQASVLRGTLVGLRADRLLAISISPGLESLLGVLNGVDKAVAAKGSLAASKALGDAAADLVYTPVTPCRLFDTRASQGGLGTPTIGVRRTYGATTPVASQGNVAGCAAPAGAAVALIQIGTLTPSGNGLLQGGPQGAASFPNALILYQSGDQYGTAVAMPLNPANGRFDMVEQFATADLYGDLLGYFAAPASGLVTPDMRPPTVVDATGKTVGTLQIAAQNPHWLVYRSGGDLFVFPVEYFIDERQVNPATSSGTLLFETTDCSGQAYIEWRASAHFRPAGPRIGLLVYAPGNPPGPYNGHWLLYATAPGPFYQKDVPFVARSARSNYPAICQVLNSQLKYGFPMNVIEDLASKFVEPYGLK